MKMMTREFRASLASMASTLKLLNRGFFGDMEERVAEKLRELLAKANTLAGVGDIHYEPKDNGSNFVVTLPES